MGNIIDVKNSGGSVGKLHDISSPSDSILIFQVNRLTKDINQSYLDSARDSLKNVLPEGKSAIVVGCDINVYELAGSEAIVLKLKGII